MHSIFPYIHIPIYKLSSNFVVEAFGVLVAIGVIMGAWLAVRRAERLKLDVNLLIDSFFVVIPGGFALAHWVALFAYFPERVARDPLQIVYFWAGISSFGGILGGLLVAWIFFYYKKVETRPYLETLAFGLIPGFTMGRVGCTVAHDHAGMWMVNNANNPLLVGTSGIRKAILPTVQEPAFWIFAIVVALSTMLIVSIIRENRFMTGSNLLAGGLVLVLLVLASPAFPEILRSLAIPWPVSSSFKTNPHQFGAHLFWGDSNLLLNGKQVLVKTRLAFDLGLIELIFYIFLICGIAALAYGKKPRRDSTILAVWFISYAPVRFLLDYLRVWDKRYFGLTPGQYLCICMFLIGVYFYATMPEQRWGEYVPPSDEETATAEA